MFPVRSLHNHSASLSALPSNQIVWYWLFAPDPGHNRSSHPQLQMRLRLQTCNKSCVSVRKCSNCAECKHACHACAFTHSYMDSTTRGPIYPQFFLIHVFDTRTHIHTNIPTYSTAATAAARALTLILKGFLHLHPWHDRCKSRVNYLVFVWKCL